MSNPARIRMMKPKKSWKPRTTVTQMGVWTMKVLAPVTAEVYADELLTSDMLLCYP
jgi:hypothetical protein